MEVVNQLTATAALAVEVLAAAGKVDVGGDEQVDGALAEDP